ncbi:MAG: HI0074 family nucleotidyltransferase substrate-binding subunit [Lachnospiraceae bacterium]
MEQKFYKRYESFCNLLESLSEAKERDLSDSFVLSGTGAKFSITFDLSWKIMKDIITQVYMVSDFAVASPREVLRKAFELRIIDEGDDWLIMLRLRNTLSHDYDGVVIAQTCDKIVNNYIATFDKFKGTVEKIINSEN